MPLIDPYSDALLIAAIPIAMLYGYFFLYGHGSSRLFSFLTGFATITFFYIVAIDPSLAAALYTSQGNYGFPIEVAVISGALLVISFHYFKKSEVEPES